MLEDKFVQDRVHSMYEDLKFSKSSTVHLFYESAGQLQTTYSIYSLDEKKVEPKWVLSRRFSKKHGYHEPPIIKFIAFNDHIYCFELVESESKIRSRPSFRVYSSLDFALESPKILSPFPVTDISKYWMLNYTNLCGFSNDSIYLYSDSIYHFSRVQNTHYVKNFNEEEYQRNFYFYCLNRDEWLPVNPMKRPVKHACLISDDNLLYLIGGEDKLPLAYVM